ncbi:phosphoribosylformylglycinamidine cyclo-ligase [Candidatus Peregrinibacteria bacterium]|nr:phosphoribosylformylglycinamidine cyclo-ligase [Candidatus Peregrinibacteria bacterium]
MSTGKNIMHRATYKEAGVDVSLGDRCSKIAYGYAKQTFSSRKGMIGEPVNIEGGFSGVLDMGDFYLVQNSDGVGSKIEIARLVGKYDTLGYDLLAMVADDAVCLGAEVISMVNTIDTEKVDPRITEELMKGLTKACREQNIVIAGGEIAEMPDHIKGMTWNASAVGIVEKSKLITGKNIVKGDIIVGLQSRGFRSNGFTLVRHILKGDKKMGQVCLTPSVVYHRCVLDMVGAYKKKRIVNIHGIAHITGGGIYNNTGRILSKGRKAIFNNLPDPRPIMKTLMEMGNVSETEAYKTWNMGVGMVLICEEKEVSKIQKIADNHGIKSQKIGYIQ